jgi:mono/diheme cytochrome c family protein
MMRWSIALLVATSLALLAGAQQSKHAVQPSPRLIGSLEGADLYRFHCASCHGKAGHGDGPTAEVLTKAVPDLTQIARRNGGRFPRKKMEDIIAGIDVSTAAHGSREMPIWGPVFSQIEWDQDLGKVRLRNLTDYLESMQQR